mgnify:CR=1 FL=1
MFGFTVKVFSSNRFADEPNLRHIALQKGTFYRAIYGKTQRKKARFAKRLNARRLQSGKNRTVKRREFVRVRHDA